MENVRFSPKPGEVWRHFKGNLYIIIDVATHTETKERYVVYRNTKKPNKTWIRPLEMFMESFLGNPKYMNNVKYRGVTYRFVNTNKNI